MSLGWELVRKWYTAQSVIGEMLIAGKHECFSLELPDLNNHPQTSCIPEGEYVVSIYFSKHANRWVILLMDVPGRSMIECHPANYPRELLGCIAPGVTRGENAVWSSDVAFEGLIPKLLDAIKESPREPITLTVRKDAAA